MTKGVLLCVCVCVWKNDENKRQTTLSDFRKKHLIPILHTFLPFGWVSGKSLSSPPLLPLSLTHSLSGVAVIDSALWWRVERERERAPLIFNSPFLFSSLIIVFILCALLSVTVWIDIQRRLKVSLHMCLRMLLCLVYMQECIHVFHVLLF